MDWKPKPLLAAALGALIQWPAMLYVMRPLLAVAYLLLSLAAIWVALATPVDASFAALARWAPLGASLACATHAWYVASRQAPGAKPEYARWYVLAGAFGLFAFLLTRTFVAEPFRIPSSAMHPTLPVGSFIVVHKLGYGRYGTYGIDLPPAAPLVRPERGDIVVFKYPRDPSQDYIKRVVGMPGDTVEFVNGELHLNGAAVRSTRLRMDAGLEIRREMLAEPGHEIARRVFPLPSPGDGKWTVPENSYFVSGDNRDNSEDSRYWGFVSADAIVGKLSLVAWKGTGTPRY